MVQATSPPQIFFDLNHYYLHEYPKVLKVVNDVFTNAVTENNSINMRIFRVVTEILIHFTYYKNNSYNANYIDLSVTDEAQIEILRNYKNVIAMQNR